MKSKFTNEEKQAILERYILKSESPTSIIRSVGISKSTFYKWLSDYRKEQTDAKRKGLTLRNFNLLEAKVKRLEGIIEIIKKANVLPNAPLQQKLYVAEKLSAQAHTKTGFAVGKDLKTGTLYAEEYGKHHHQLSFPEIKVDTETGEVLDEQAPNPKIIDLRKMPKVNCN